ncbi:MAG: aldehyde dehydrogenase family protein [Deltaproteobacteria bacterium]|nr:aldehyde dehydrogenase family protein [Deltaproteobacteria bacterium]
MSAEPAPSRLVVRSPANGEVVGEVPISTSDEVRAAVARARAAQGAWAARPIRERMGVLLKVRELLLGDLDKIVALSARENGKPRHEGLLHEGFAPLELLTYFGTEAERILEPQPIPLRLLKHRASYIHYVPRGVVAIIAPWNFPHHLAFGGAAMALVAGNAVVIKPSEFTPLITQHVRELYVKAGVPPECIEVVYGHGDTGATLIDSGVDMVEFTGSVATGKKVAAMCGERLIPCVLELGGKAPALVLDDADQERALHATLWGGFANAGQVCASIERLLVHQKVYDSFVPRLVERVKALRMGDASASAEVDIGPLVNQRQLEIVERLVDDAVRKGATVACGGKRVDGPGYFFEPTVLLDVTTEMDIVNRETFGPVVPVMKMPGEAEMVAEANRSHLGLLAYVFTRDGERGRRVAEQIRCGTVMVNDVIASAAMAETPWGGLKQSGLGHTHSDDGLRHMCEARHVNYDLLPWLKKELWWYPYNEKDVGMLRRMMNLLYGRGLNRFR